MYLVVVVVVVVVVYIILTEDFLNPFSTTRGLSTLLAGFAYRKMGFAHPKRALWTPARGAIYDEIRVLGILKRQYHH